MRLKLSLEFVSLSFGLCQQNAFDVLANYLILQKSIITLNEMGNLTNESLSVYYFSIIKAIYLFIHIFLTY